MAVHWCDEQAEERVSTEPDCWPSEQASAPYYSAERHCAAALLVVACAAGVVAVGVAWGLMALAVRCGWIK